MPTGRPLTGKNRPRTECNCNEYHRPRSSAQFCQCGCHTGIHTEYELAEDWPRDIFTRGKKLEAIS